MKNKVYVERYSERLLAGDTSAAAEIVQCFVNEYNADVKRLHVTKDVAAKRLLAEYNRKGNELAGMLRQKCGIGILKPNWFAIIVEYIREAENGGADDGK